MSNPGFILFLIGAILYMGVIGSIMFERYRIPDVINLIAIGLLVGPISHIIKPDILTPWMPYVGAIALSLILFEGGLDLDFKNVVSRFGFSLILSSITFLTTMLLIASVYHLIVGAPLIPSLLLGAILGCVSSAIIIPVAQKVNASADVKTGINLESIFSDLWGVIATLVLVRIGSTKNFDAGHVVNSIIGSFSTALVGATILGLLWLWALDRLKKSPFSYMMTLAAVFVLYGLVEIVHGSGPMAALAFGVVLTNAEEIMDIFGKKFKFVLDDKIRLFNTEATFFTRTFFFVYLGLIFSVRSISFMFILTSFAIFFSILVCRYGVVKITTRVIAKELDNLLLYMAMIPRGLTSAVLAGIAVSSQIPGTEYFLEYTFATILLTNLLMTWAIYRTEKPMDKTQAAPPDKNQPKTA